MWRIGVWLAVWALWSGNSWAQSPSKVFSKKAVGLLDQAKATYLNGDADQAILLLDAVLTREPNYLEALYVKADILNQQKRYAEELALIRRGVAIDSLYFLPAYYNAGAALFHLGEYAEAVEWFGLFERYMGTKKTRLNAARWIEKSLFAQKAKQNPVEYNPQKVEGLAPAHWEIYWPSLSADESELVYTALIPRDTTGWSVGLTRPVNARNFQEDLYRVALPAHAGTALPFGALNTPGNEGAQSLSPDGQWLFFSACNREDGLGSCDLYFSRQTAGGWSAPVNLGHPVNTPYFESQPCWAADGKTLYFVSNRPGGKGDRDIYEATLAGFHPNGTPLFGGIKNLGPRVNTSGQEDSPFMHYDLQTLYFSSDGWAGMGGLDLFKVTRNYDGQWAEAVNLGYPINTHADESGLVLNATGEHAYFAAGGVGHSNKQIYRFELPMHLRPAPASYVKGLVKDKTNGAPLAAGIELIDVQNGKVAVRAQSNAFDGTYLVCLPTGADYALNVNKEGYLFYSGHFALSAAHRVVTPFELEALLSPIRQGEKVVLRNVFFALNSSDLMTESAVELDLLVRLLTQNNALNIEIGGHTDSSGTVEYNLTLSQMRAERVRGYLIDAGIESARLKAKGFGMSEPMAPNDTEAGRALNRRTEIRILQN